MSFLGTQGPIDLHVLVLIFKPVPDQENSRVVIGNNTQDLGLELKMRSLSPDPLRGGVTR